MKKLSFFLLFSTLVFFTGCMQQNSPQSNNTQNSTSGQTQSPPETQPQKKEFKLILKDGKLIAGPLVLMVQKGTDVTITIESDQEEEFHLHGYDKSIELKKDIPAKLTFTADKTGRFTYELEKAQTELGALEVLPE